ncbi:hypothetical protein KJ359_004883 [Pestalotiopsis sp. 9143b]|nr:hypothetical protein KJ359_004883 [Pestalotiopsis sp. 9143b]
MAIMRSRDSMAPRDAQNVSIHPRWATVPALPMAVMPQAVALRRQGTAPAAHTRHWTAAAVADEGLQRSRMLQSSQRARDVWAPRSRRHLAVADTGALSDEERARRYLAAAGQRARPGGAVPLAGFERLFADVGFSVLNLDELIGAATLRITDTSFSHGPSNLSPVIAPSESYFSHLPARYGRAACLDDALRCIAVKVRRVLSPGATYAGAAADAGGDAGLYGKALRSLQSAITSDSWADPDVLCAAELISVYELLEGPSRLTAWSSHLSGSARLICSRGPAGFKTDFDRALFIAMLGSVVSEAWLSGQPCFLNEPSWRDFLQGLMRPDSGLSLRTRNYVWLGYLGAKLTDAWARLDELMADPGAVKTSDLREFEQLCLPIKAEAGLWRRQYEDHLVGGELLPGAALSTADAHRRPWLEVLSAGCSLQTVVSRLLGAISPANRAAEEREALTHSATSLRILRSAISSVRDSRTASTYMFKKGAVSQSIFATTHLWLRGCDESRRPVVGPCDVLIDRDVYRTWREFITAGSG